MRKLELLIPAGSLDVLKTAVLYGADAVYLGGEAFGLRAKAKNFTNEEIKEGIAFAHERGVKVYITANIFAHNDDLAGVEEYFTELKEIKPDALIISDPGVFEIARRILPEMEIHISTQANNTNYGTFLFCNSFLRADAYTTSAIVTNFRKNHWLIFNKYQRIELAKIHTFSTAVTFFGIKLRESSKDLLFYAVCRLQKKSAVGFLHIAVNISGVLRRSRQISSNKSFPRSALAT